MLANFLIGLREGLEAALVIGLLLGYLVKVGRSEARRWVWTGVVAALALCLVLGSIVTVGSLTLSDQAQETLGGLLSWVAAGLVTWMVLWLAKRSHLISGQVRAAADRALMAGPWWLVTLAFAAVAREGIETTIFVWTSTLNAGAAGNSTLGVALGLLVAVALGVVIYQGTLRINLSRVFAVTGVALVVVAAGLASAGLHELQEAGWLPESGLIAFDVSGVVPADGIVASVLRGLVGFRPITTVEEFVVWAAYLVVVGGALLRSRQAKALSA